MGGDSMTRSAPVSVLGSAESVRVRWREAFTASSVMLRLGTFAIPATGRSANALTVATAASPSSHRGGCPRSSRRIVRLHGQVTEQKTVLAAIRSPLHRPIIRPSASGSLSIEGRRTPCAPASVSSSVTAQEAVGQIGALEVSAVSTPVTTSLNAWRPVSQTARVAVRERGRICAMEGCDTILSIYNPAKYCSAHLAEMRSGQRRGLDHAVREVACQHCGSPFKTRNPRHLYCSDRCRMAAFARRRRAAERAGRAPQEEMVERRGSLEIQLINAGGAGHE